mgnify:CR=1 FL=1
MKRRTKVTEYYTPKLDKLEYLHLLSVMKYYGAKHNNYTKPPLSTVLHERTNEALMKAQEKQHGKA